MAYLKCLICGMIINDKNYDFNNTTFLDKNEKNNIINCPFCGVGRMYLVEENRSLNINPEELDDKTKKILENAMKLEKFNAEFYEEASKLAQNEENKKMFKELSSVELMHANIHKKLGGFKKLPVLQKLDYSRHETDEMLVKEANNRERHAIAYYTKNMKHIDNEELREVLKNLAEVERQHQVITDEK